MILDGGESTLAARRFRRGHAGHRPHLPAVGGAAPVPQRVHARRHGGLPARGRAAGRAAGPRRLRHRVRLKTPLSPAQDVVFGEESSTTGSRIPCVLCPFCSADSTQVIDTRPIPATACAGGASAATAASASRPTSASRGRSSRWSSATAGASASIARSCCAGSPGRPAGGRSARTSSRRSRRGSPRRPPRRQRGRRPASIGDLAERGLARVDPVSAIQFASVYRNLADLDELAAVVRRFKDDPLPGEDQLASTASPFRPVRGAASVVPA